MESPEVTIIPNAVRETAASDSDSDGPILYKDEEEEDEEDEYTSSMCFSCAAVLQKSFSESSDGLNWESQSNENFFCTIKIKINFFNCTKKRIKCAKYRQGYTMKQHSY